ncbi:single-stranded DNA-binding protein [Peptoniphilus sp.]|jgi:single-strand DNA-binding protein|uniref:single-stranded DNA-binding protein n=1 Tax=Peptoniphilus sp. TaxID=1971214 RepID=UPI003D8C2CAC
MNSVCLIGRLTRDPIVRYSQNGMAIARFTVAVDRRLSRQKKQEMEANNQQTADFIGCTAFGSTAELISNYFKKGSQIGVEGRIQTGSYEKDGRTVYTTDVVVNNITFISSSGGGQNMGGFNQNQGGFSSPNQNSGPVNSAYGDDFSSVGNNDNDGFFPIDDEDIPF